MKELYEMIFKRKSFRRFNEALCLSENELQDIHNKIKYLSRLENGIKIHYQIVPREKTSCKRGEYCLIIYSEKKQNYLLNIGYIFEQLDLYLASKNIGVCWYGMGKTDADKYEGLDYVIMLAIGKGLESEFRVNYKKSKRKETEEIWNGDFSSDIGDIIKYAPSACNTQPWRVICKDNSLKIYRTAEVKSIMPKEKIPFYNSIDMGIFLCFLEITLMHMNYKFERKLCEGACFNDELLEIAEYIIN